MKKSFKDYRIGNLVTYDNRVFEIATLAEEFPTLNTIEFGIGVVDWSNIENVKITDSLMTSSGFEKVKGKKYYSHKDEPLLRFFLFENALHCSIGDDDDGVIFNRLTAFHQLQNLWFTFTRKELSNE